MNEYIYFQQNAARFDLDKAEFCDISRNTSFKFSLPRAFGVILQPSFCCPTILEPEQPLEIFMLINQGLQESYYLGKKLEGKYGAISEIFMRRVNLQLRYNSWSQVKSQPGYKAKDIFLTNNKLFDTNTLNNDIPIFATEPIKIEKQDLSLHDVNKNLVGFVPNKVIKHYLLNEINYYTKIIITNHPLKNLNKNNGYGTLYNLSWMAIETDNMKNLEKNTLSPFAENQDILMQQACSKYGLEYLYGFNVDLADNKELDLTPNKDTPLISYHPIYLINKKKLGIGHLTDLHVSSRQELFKKSKLQVIKGASEKLSPIIGTMVHSCFDSVRDLLQQMGENRDVDLLFITGDLVDYSLNLDLNKVKDSNLDDHLTTWDLINLKNRYKQTKFNKLRKVNNFSNKKNLEIIENHSIGIDIVIIYSLIKNYYDKYQKPIFFTSGNHDSYKMPYGISPRIASVARGLKSRNLDDGYNKIFDAIKANDGIPQDHNLTFYEAILMYGPGYADIINFSNFNREVGDISYHLFSPVTDFSFRYKNQVFTGLNWGDGESIVENTIVSLEGSLPRANNSLNHIQIKLLEEATARAGFTCKNILFWHAPIVNYNAKKPLETPYRQQANSINITKNNKILPFSNCDVGSFTNNKYSFFDKFIANGALTHTFSGHSHRLGLYQCLGYTDMPKPSKWNLDRARDVYSIDATAYTRGFELPVNQPIDIDKAFTRQHKHSFNNANKYPKHINYLAYSRDTKMLVSGSAGLIGIKNTFGELGGHGLNSPSGTILTYKNNKEILSCITSNSNNAKPRFAAMLDGLDTLESPGIFTKFECNDLDSAEFKIDINPQLSYWDDEQFQLIDFIDEITLVVNSNNENIKYNLQIKDKIIIDNKSARSMFYRLKDKINNNANHSKVNNKKHLRYIMNDANKFIEEFKYKYAKSYLNTIYYISILLKEVSYFSKTYDFTHRWNIFADIGIKTGSKSSPIKKIYLKKHKKYGEVPNFELYSKT